MLRNLLKGIGRFAAASPGDAGADDWPLLPTRGFIAGRPAQTADVERGNAIFVAAVDGQVIGKPLPIPIPQYAYLRDTRARVIVVQAEEANGTRLFGVRGLDGKEAVTQESDLELLGTRMPD